MVELYRLLALGIFASYFILIITLFALILASLRPRSTTRNGTTAAVCVFGALSVTSFAHTWYCESYVIRSVI